MLSFFKKERASRLRLALSLGSLLAASLLAAPRAAHAAGGVYEEFDYTAGNLIGPSSWTQSAAAGTTGQALVVGGTSLTFAGLPRSDAQNHSLALGSNGTSTGSGQEGLRSLTAAIAGPDAYMSFLINVSSAPTLAATGTNTTAIIAFHESTSATFFRGAVSLYSSPNSGKYMLGVSHHATSVAAQAGTELNVGQTYFVILRETRVGTGTDNNDTCKLYINPVPTNPEPGTTTVTYTTDPSDNDWPDASTLDGVFIRQRRFAGAFAATIDAIRAGSTWLDVTAGSAPPPVDPKLLVPATFALGNVGTSSTLTSPLTLQNAGPAQPLHILAGSAFSGPGAARFSIFSGATQTIPAASTSTLSLRFTSNAVIGLSTATLALKSDSQTSTFTNISLSANTVPSLPIYEPFKYNPGTKLSTNSRYYWNAFTNAGATAIPVLDTPGDTSKSLAYSGMPIPSGRRAQLRGLSSGSEESIKSLFTNQITNGSIYASMLLRVTSATLEKTGTSNSSILAGFNKHTAAGSDATQGNLRIITSLQNPTNSNGKFSLGLSSTSFNNVDVDFTGIELSSNVTYFLVMKYTIGAGGDTVKLWINPTWAGATEGLGAAQQVIHTSRGADVNMTATDVINGFVLQQQTFAGKFSADVDELRVGTSYADVTTGTGAVTPPPPPNAAHEWTSYR